MRSASLCYSYNKDEKLYKILSDTVNDLISTMDKKGRITTYSDERELKGWDMWCRKYVILGLTYFYEICVDEKQKQKIAKRQKLKGNKKSVLPIINVARLLL